MSYPKNVPPKSGKYSVYVHFMKPTGKRYVGCTGQKPQRRFQNGIGYEKNEPFFADIKRYGWESVDTTIIAETDDFELAASFENAAIERFDTLNPERGYNHWRSGSVNTPTAEVGKHISAAKMGHEVTAETREKLRHYGCLPVAQLDKDGNVLKIHESMTQAAESVGAFKSNIYAVCKGKKRTCRGFGWRYAEERDRVKHA